MRVRPKTLGKQSGMGGVVNRIIGARDGIFIIAAVMKLPGHFQTLAGLVHMSPDLFLDGLIQF